MGIEQMDSQMPTLVIQDGEHLPTAGRLAISQDKER
jgi:hypothetical protein